MPSERYSQYNLAAADEKLTSYLKTKQPDGKEVEFLYSIQNQIRTLHSQRGWIRYGILNKDGNPPSQKKITDEYIKAQQDSTMFTKIIVIKMLEKLDDTLVGNLNSEFKKIINEIKECAEATLSSIKRNEQRINYSYEDQIETKVNFVSNEMIKLAQLLKGRYIPFNQGCDPLV